MGKRPGVLLYFDRVVFLNRLSDEENGKLFRAIILYARDGIEPEFSDQALLMAWDFLRPALDEDAESYDAKCEKNRQNAVKRWHANGCERMPTTDADTTSSTRTNQMKPHHNDLERAQELLKKSTNGKFYNFTGGYRDGKYQSRNSECDMEADARWGIVYDA